MIQIQSDAASIVEGKLHRGNEPKQFVYLHGGDIRGAAENLNALSFKREERLSGRRRQFFHGGLFACVQRRVNRTAAGKHQSRGSQESKG